MPLAYFTSTNVHWMTSPSDSVYALHALLFTIWTQMTRGGCTEIHPHCMPLAYFTSTNVHWMTSPSDSVYALHA